MYEQQIGTNVITKYIVRDRYVIYIWCILVWPNVKILADVRCCMITFDRAAIPISPMTVVEMCADIARAAFTMSTSASHSAWLV